MTPRAFHRYLGIHYSGAETPDSGLKNLRVYSAAPDTPPQEVLPPPGPRKYWSRRELAHWLPRELAGDMPTIVGIDHALSFPLRYFEVHRLAPDWMVFLEDFHRHWPTDAPHTYVDFILNGVRGEGSARMGNPRWMRLTDERCPAARSVFQFEGQGKVAAATHAGLPWIMFLKRELGERLRLAVEPPGCEEARGSRHQHAGDGHRLDERQVSRAAHDGGDRVEDAGQGVDVAVGVDLEHAVCVAPRWGFRSRAVRRWR
jgi:hypothetical protein